MPPTAYSSIEIQAPIDVVWDAMVDLAHYGEWNPFIVAVDFPAGTLCAGTPLVLHVKWVGGGGVASHEEIARIEPPALTGGTTAVLAYKFKGRLAALGLVVGTRVQSLTRLTPTSVRYESRELFHGLLNLFVPLKKVQAGFDAHAAALKERAESIRARGEPRE